MRYRTVVIDPPWPVQPISAQAGKKLHSPLPLGLPYKTMTISKIKLFPINDFADENCALFLWTTQGFLQDAIELANYWNFKFSKLITWDKKEGINWLGWTMNSEFVVFAYRGKYPILVKPGKSMPTVFSTWRTRHSEKPGLFYSKILQITPAPRIDIFARRKHFGFDSWGNEVDDAPTIEQFSI